MRRQIYCVSVFVLLTILLSFSTVWAGSKDENNGYKMFDTKKMIPSYQAAVNQPFIFRYWEDIKVYNQPDIFSPPIDPADLDVQRYILKGYYGKKIQRQNSFLVKMVNEKTGKVVWYQYHDHMQMLSVKDYENPSGVVRLSENQLPSSKKDWIDSEVIFTKEKIDDHKNNAYRASDINYTPDFDIVRNLYSFVGETFKIEGYYRGNYRNYWKLVGEKGHILWYEENGGDYYKPFYLASELGEYKRKQSILKSYIGTSLWVNKNNLFDLGELNLAHLEHVTVRNIEVNPSESEMKVTLAKDDGTVVVWKPFSTAISLIMSDSQYAFFPEFFTFNPYTMHPEWSNEIWQAIKSGVVRVGWNKDMCILSWGFPDKVNKTTGSWGTSEQWVYKYRGYLYFTDGTLETIQD